MKKARRQAPGSSVPSGVQPDVLAERGAEALRRERFKEAVEFFKQAIRLESRPEWRHALADAYRGRARELAAKGMFKEAAIVLENTIVPGAPARDPSLYLCCLLRDGQQQKAAGYLLDHPPAHDQEDLKELAAALLLSVSRLPDPAPGASPEQLRWRELAIASRAALAAWCDGAAAAEIDQQLNRISLRSAFRPLRLLLKNLIDRSEDIDRSRRMLETIAPGSAFFPLRQAVAAALLQRDGALDGDAWNRLTPGQRAFVSEGAGLSAVSCQFLARLSEAEREGPRMLFNFLARQNDQPREAVRNACLNLLPQIPDRLSHFEKRFGDLTPVERPRIQALAAESRGDWKMAAGFWRATAGAVEDAGSDRTANLTRGVIYRHLAHLADRHPEFEFESLDDRVISYLQRANDADPEHLSGWLDLIEHCRKDPEHAGSWHRLADEAARRFPDNARVLQLALDSALARKAYKKAAGFARRLLRLNSISHGVRRQMIELQISYARKQMRAKRPDLAMKALAEAAEWERTEAPSAPLRIAHALVERQTGAPDLAEARLREGVALAGGGVPGWFRARFEAEQMKAGSEIGWLHQELIRAREEPPTPDAILAVVATLAQPETGEKENRKALASLLVGMRSWLRQGAVFDWKPAEFEAVADMFSRFEAFDLQRDYAQAARKRNPANSAWRYHDIVARVRGNAERLSAAEVDDLIAIAEAAADRNDFHLATRINRLIDRQAGPRRRGHGGSVGGADELDDDDVLELFKAMLESMPRNAIGEVRRLVREVGREQALKEMLRDLKSSPLESEMPETLLRELAAAMVEKAMGGASPRRDRTGHAVPF